MIASTDVCDAIAKKVAELWPDRMIYRDFCPADHKRPSSYLYVTESGFVPANIMLVEWKMEAVLELFCATDKYDLSSTEQLREDQEAVLLAFGLPSLPVKDFFVTLEAKGSGADAGSAYVTFTAKWFDEMPGFQDPEDSAPPMEDFEVNGYLIAGEDDAGKERMR